MNLEFQARQAKGIQRVWKAYQKRKKEALAEELRLAELEVANEMDALFRAAQRQENEHRLEVSMFYDQLREKAQSEAARKKIDDREKAKVVQLRRKREWDQIRSERAVRKQQEEEEETRRLESWKSTWETRIAEETTATQTRMLNVLNQSFSIDDHDLRKEYRRRIKARVKLVAKGYKESGLDIAADLIEERATDEIVREEVDRVRQSIQLEWDNAERNYQFERQKKADEKRRNEIQEEQRQRHEAANKVQAQYRIHRARLQLLAKLRQVYVKEFNSVVLQQRVSKSEVEF